MIKLNKGALSVLLTCAVASVLASTSAAAAAQTDSKADRPKPIASGTAAIRPQSFGPELILNATTGKCVDIPGFGNGTVNGPVNQYTCNGTSRQPAVRLRRPGHR